MSAPPPSTITGVHRGACPHFHVGKLDALTAEDYGAANDAMANNDSKWNAQEATLRASNPDLTLLTYVNSMFCPSTDGGKFPSAWYMRNAAGSKLVSSYGNYLMEPRKTASFTDTHGTYSNWKAYVVKQAQLAGEDGVWLDMQGPAPMSGGYVHPVSGAGTGIPFNYQTGKDFTTGEYLAAAWAVSDALTTAGIWHVSNGLQSGQSYFATKDPTSKMLTHTDAGFAETWMRSPGNSKDGWPTEARWIKEVQMLIDANNLGHWVWVCTKYWRTAAADKLTTDAWLAVVAGWRRFCITSYLLGNRGKSLMTFTRLESETEALEADDWYDLDLGAPTSSPTDINTAKKGGVYRRAFANAMVFNNPTTAAATISASPDGRSYLLPDTTPVTYPRSIKAHTGQIWLVA